MPFRFLESPSQGFSQDIICHIVDRGVTDFETVFIYRSKLGGFGGPRGIRKIRPGQEVIVEETVEEVGDMGVGSQDLFPIGGYLERGVFLKRIKG